MSMISVSPYDPSFKDDWDAIVRQSKNGNFIHLRDYMDYHSDRFHDNSLMIYMRNRPIAVFPCSAHNSDLISHGGLTYGGLIYGAGVHAKTVLYVFQLISEYYKSEHFNRIIYKPVPRVFHAYPADEDLYCLFRVGARLSRRDLSSVIELKNRLKISDSRKSTARKAIKAGACFEEIEDLKGFHALLTAALLKYDSKPVHSFSELSLLKSRFKNNVRLFGVSLDGELLAASLIFDFGRVVHTQYMASSDHGRRSGALDYLLIKLIAETFSHKDYFSFGISTEQNGRFLNEGLVQQKEGFGGRGMVHDFYEWDL